MIRTGLLIIALALYLPMVYSQLEGITFSQLDFKDGLPDHAEPFALAQDEEGKLWYGTDKGLFVYNGADLITITPNIRDSNALTELSVQALYVHLDSSIWIGTRNLGLCRFNPVTGLFSRWLPETDGGNFPSYRIRDFYSDHEGIIWISCDDGLVRCDPASMSFRLYRIEHPGMTTIELDFYNTLREVIDDPSDKDKLWICTRHGLVSFRKSTGDFTRHRMPFSSKEVGLAEVDYMLIDMEWTSSNDLWLSTWASGIMHYNTVTQQWKRFRNPEANPLYDIVYSILPKDSDEFWYTAYQFAGTFNFEKGTYSHFGYEGGLKSSMVYNPMLITSDGALVIGGSSGIFISNEAVVKNDHVSIKPILTNIKLNEKNILLAGHHQVIHVDDKDHALRFTVAMPLYHKSQSIRYRYKLTGYDQEWNDNGTSRTIQYTNLRPGTYNFAYQAGFDGQWHEGSRDIQIVIRMPFYQSFWFLALIGLIIATFLGIVYSIRIRHLKHELRLKADFNKKLAENEMTALRAQMNPHFMFNSLNSIKNFILKENTHEASRYLTRFSQLMRAILKNSRYKLVPLEEELAALRLYIEMEAMRFNHEFEYAIAITPDIHPREVYIPPLLIQPYVENAIWHGLLRKEGIRRLVINIDRKDAHMVITIEDNGIGRQAARATKASENGTSKSFGMKITSDRIDLINRTLGIDASVHIEDLVEDNGNPCGTRVNIYIPVLFEDSFTAITEDINT